ncbi:tripartite tricarboxylate transporter TctB family protein [Modicisalibacter radicis]|uniref:tripartite tricarboxylate transporter TctB family protein n=1 Tax=Halomonas sp. EAR18 TaxID=2518972 RepID=UPI00109D3363|nr:tripartite tricarboxylate transporter TctB family protein [Halomonas sp. EAR18]
MKFDDSINGLLIICLGGAVIFLAQQLPTLQFIDYGPGFMPTLIGILLVICGLSVLAKRIALNEGKVSTWLRIDSDQSLSRALLPIGFVIIAILFYIFTVNVLGFLITMPVTLFSLLFYFNRRPGRDIAIAVIGSVAFHSFFYQLMSVQLPWGLLTPFAGVLTW